MAEKRDWNIAEQVRIAKANFDARPEWVKRISYFAGTNNVCPRCGEATCACHSEGGSK